MIGNPKRTKDARQLRPALQTLRKRISNRDIQRACWCRCHAQLDTAGDSAIRVDIPTEAAEGTDHYLRKELERLRKLNGGELAGAVLDLRNNPGGLLDQAVAVSDRFLPGTASIGLRDRE